MSDIIGKGIPDLVRKVEQQMGKWRLGQPRTRALPSRPATAPREEVHDFITISNDIGGGGGDVVAMLGERLGWPVFDRDILTSMANEDKMRERLYESLDERDITWLEETAQSLIHTDFEKNDYFHRLTETLLGLAHQGPAVFVGRASDLILPRRIGLRIKLIVSEERRIQNFAEHNEMTPKEASRKIERINRDRAGFIYKNFQVDLNDPMRFDLLINLERYSPAQSVDLIVAAAGVRGLKLPRQSRRES
jgi:cytidylate kinase